MTSPNTLPSCTLFDLVVDMDWDAVMAHVEQHPEDAKWQDHHGDDGGETPLYMACQYHAPLDAIEAIIEAYPAALRIENRNGNVPLHIACHYDAGIEIVNALVEADPHTVFLGTKWGKTPMNALYDGFLKRSNTDTMVITEEQWEKMEALLRAVALQENLKTSRGELLYLHAAVSLGGSGCPRGVFEYTMDRYSEQVYERDPVGRLPLHVAAGPVRRVRFRHFIHRNYRPNELHVFQRLLRSYPHGARITDIQGRLPLHCAISNGRTWAGGVELLFLGAPDAIAAVDPITGLLPFVLAAVAAGGGVSPCLDTTFLLLSSQPHVLTSCSPSKESTTSTVWITVFETLQRMYRNFVHDASVLRHCYTAACVAVLSAFCVGTFVAVKTEN